MSFAHRRILPAELAAEFPAVNWCYANARGAGRLAAHYSIARDAIDAADNMTIARARRVKPALVAAINAAHLSAGDRAFPPARPETPSSGAATGPTLPPRAVRCTVPLRDPPWRVAGRAHVSSRQST